MKKSSTNGNKEDAPRVAMLGFLWLLNQISTASEVLEFCTPGHKAGRGFEILLSTEPAQLVLDLPEEVK